MVYLIVSFIVAMFGALLLGFGVLSGLPALAFKALSFYLLMVVVVGLLALTIKPRS